MRYLTILLVLLVVLPATVSAAEDPSRLVPVPGCGSGWALEGKAAVYDRDTLSDRIDGEAEIFFPYGFQYLAYGRYARGEKGFDLDVYRMGSLLDAFGMYAAYRPDGAGRLALGSDAAVTATQLFFYQDRYFVRLQSTGEGEAGKDALAACAKVASSLLPATKEAPGELRLLDVDGVDKESIRYNATSLLGYDFFPRGLTADAVIAGAPARIFLVLTDSPAAAQKALHGYRTYLQQGHADVKGKGDGGNGFTAVDPLYGTVVARQEGRYVVGMARLQDAAAAWPVLEKLRLRLE